MAANSAQTFSSGTNGSLLGANGSAAGNPLQKLLASRQNLVSDANLAASKHSPAMLDFIPKSKHFNTGQIGQKRGGKTSAAAKVNSSLGSGIGDGFLPLYPLFRDKSI